MKLVELVRQQLVQLFKNYSGKDNEIKKICEIYVMYIWNYGERFKVVP